MQSLAQRHEDRARRIAMNRSERTGGPVMGVGTAALLYRNFADARARIPENFQEELATALVGIDEEFAGGSRSLAESPDGSGQTMAGIGVVNTQVVPAASIAVSDDGKGSSHTKDAAWGETPPATVEPLPVVEPTSGNVNGQALVDQLGEPGAGENGTGWGTTGSPSTAELKKPPVEGEGSGGGGGQS